MALGPLYFALGAGAAELPTDPLGTREQQSCPQAVPWHPGTAELSTGGTRNMPNICGGVMPENATAQRDGQLGNAGTINKTCANAY
jgi:hypothetical protein